MAALPPSNNQTLQTIVSNGMSAQPSSDPELPCTEQQAAAPGVCPIKNLGYGSSKRPIEAILVFKDPADWYLDLQIMTDVIMGGEPNLIDNGRAYVKQVIILLCSLSHTEGVWQSHPACP